MGRFYQLVHPYELRRKLQAARFGPPKRTPLGTFPAPVPTLITRQRPPAARPSPLLRLQRPTPASTSQRPGRPLAGLQPPAPLSPRRVHQQQRRAGPLQPPLWSPCKWLVLLAAPVGTPPAPMECRQHLASLAEDYSRLADLRLEARRQPATDAAAPPTVCYPVHSAILARWSGLARSLLSAIDDGVAQAGGSGSGRALGTALGAPLSGVPDPDACAFLAALYALPSQQALAEVLCSMRRDTGAEAAQGLGWGGRHASGPQKRVCLQLRTGAIGVYGCALWLLPVLPHPDHAPASCG